MQSTFAAEKQATLTPRPIAPWNATMVPPHFARILPTIAPFIVSLSPERGSAARGLPTQQANNSKISACVGSGWACSCGRSQPQRVWAQATLHDRIPPASLFSTLRTIASLIYPTPVLHWLTPANCISILTTPSARLLRSISPFALLNARAATVRPGPVGSP
jgi:hypothetical protein